MSDDKLYIQAAKEARRSSGTERDESLWAEAQASTDGNEIDARNHYVKRRVEQLKASLQPAGESSGEGSSISSVDDHPDFISVAKYSARNNVDERHVIQSINDGHYRGREVAGDWYIFIGKNKFSTFEEKKDASFFFENANEIKESRLPGEEPPDNLVDLRRKPQ